ncbi:MAG: methionyl-tRNA formyltransferase [Candidatus Moraniibacteriota bacterium]
MTNWLKDFFSKRASTKNTGKEVAIPVTLTGSQAQSTKKKISPVAVKQPTQTPKVRVVFMGTPILSATLLEALIVQGYNIVGVVTKPDRPIGRKQTVEESPVKETALKHNLPILQPEKIDAATLLEIQNWKPDVVVVAAYGKILPERLLSLPGFGCVNFHTSLLPKWRGASPIQNAILSGATETGVTIMLMDKGMDTGDILTQKTVPIDPDDTTPTLTDKLLVAGQALLLETLPLWIERHITPTKQDNEKATLCQLIERSDGHIMWSDDAESIYNRYRALYPWPGVFTYWKKSDNLLRLKLLTLSYQKENIQPTKPLGAVFEIDGKIGIQTSVGVIFPETVQLEGKTPVSIKEFLLGNEGFIGSFLE